MKKLKKIHWPNFSVAVFMDHTGKAYFVYNTNEHLYKIEFKKEYLVTCHPNTFELRENPKGIFRVDDKMTKNKLSNHYWSVSDWRNSVVVRNNLKDKLDDIL